MAVSVFRGNIFKDESAGPLVALAVSALFALIALMSGFATSWESGLRDARDGLRETSAPSDIVIVEVDGRSLQQLPRWPWPRGLYADAVTELNRLGADQIAFDLEFSAHSDPDQDLQFARALEDLDKKVILPTFRQVNQSADGPVVSEALPIEILREHAFLASVNVIPEADGRILQYPYGTVTDNLPRPSLATMLAGDAGKMGEAFPIDQAIAPASFDRIAFVDLINGDVAREKIAGKQILIGATAVELGDRYPTSLFGVQPGVVIQAQAAETLSKGRIRADVGQHAPALACFGLLLWACLSKRWRSHALLISVGLAGTVLVAALTLDQLSLAYVQVATAFVLLGAFAAVSRVIRLLHNLQAARLTDPASGLPNRWSMENAAEEAEMPAFAVARITDTDQIEALASGDALADIDRAIAHRLSVLTSDLQVYRIERGLFAWFVNEQAAGELDPHFSSAANLLNLPIEHAGQKLKLKPVFGFSQSSLADAVAASEFAQRKGQQWSAAHDEMGKEAQYKQYIIAELDAALEDGSISVHYQPKLALASNTISGAECLVRWNSASQGFISPADFIPILEERGETGRLTLFVLKDAIAKASAMHEAGMPVNLAVNLSVQLLADAPFIDEAIALIGQLPQSPKPLLTIEVTESAPNNDPEIAKAVLSRLRQAGVRISIDDYGTGNATLNYLKEFPANEVKLDQSFVRNLSTVQSDLLMVRSTIELAHALSFQVVAEGVEDAETLEILRAAGCDYIQGWHIGKPVPWADFECELREAKAESQQRAAAKTA